ncbi:MAG: DegT/DnrJ/EryC1/StrS family aminotransferase [Bacteroidales bacterium]|nr:DegT/DnrJ/EryC1/StrS family aminotransferase [Bacteroidales bacterium]
MKFPMVDLHGQYLKIKDEVDAAMAAVIADSAFINGRAVTDFQQSLAQYLGCRHVVTCGNGTDALQIALLALNLQPGDEVITTPFTFVATAEAAAILGLKPVFVDVDPHTYNINVSQIEAAVTPRTRAILPVHLFGQCADMEPLLVIARRHHLFVIEDACQAIGAEYTFSDGRKCKAGTMGDIGCTSFFPSKNLGCFGDGGALFTQDDNLALCIRSIANHGSVEKYHHERLGMNSRLDTLQAAVLQVKLSHLDEYTVARQQAAMTYNRFLSDDERWQVPALSPNSTHVFHQYTLRLADGRLRADLQSRLKSAGIASAIYYPVPLHLQAAYANLDYRRGDLPAAEQLADTVLSLPMHTELSETQIAEICLSLKG